MQAGFSLLEAGSVSQKNLTNILFKNIMDACISSICFWFIGYGIAFGKTYQGVVGSSNFFLSDIKNGVGGAAGDDGWAKWFFQWAFAGTSTTIVSGCVAERTRFEAYLLFAGAISTVIYPVVVHWVWGEGFLSAWGAYPDDEGNARPLLTGTAKSNGMLDFAGSGVVHMVGGFCGLIGAILVGPRRFRFDAVTGIPAEAPPGDPMLLCLGTLILWFGWYAFNCGSTLALSGNAANVAGKAALSTTISATTACMLATSLARIFDKYFNISVAVNGVLCGLVSITAACAFTDPWMAFIIGGIGAVIFFFSRSALLKLGIDDPLDAFPVHGACGLWGVVAAGIFCTDANVQYAGYPNVNNACSSGEQFGVQLIGASSILLWTTITAGFCFWVLRKTIGIRVSASVEEDGLDNFEHGGYIIAMKEKASQDGDQNERGKEQY